MEFISERGEQRYASFVRAAARGIVGLDFDGTLAPIVDDPEAAHIHPEAAEVLVELARQVSALAVITGRPARQVLELGGLEAVGRAVSEAGKELYVFGQYGNERWSSQETGIVSARPPAGLASFERELPGTLRRLGAAEAWVEDKGIAVAVHLRRLPDSFAVFDRLLPELRTLAESHDLSLEPGRNVIEVRSPGVHKGQVVESLAADLDAQAFCFAGDDLGDLEALEAVGRLDEQGLDTLRVCAASEEESALMPYADVVVRGPDGVMALLRELASDAASTRA